MLVNKLPIYQVLVSIHFFDEFVQYLWTNIATQAITTN